MAKGAIAATADATKLVAADNSRGTVVLQHISGDPVFLEFGTMNAAESENMPVVDQGLVLSEDAPVIVVTKPHLVRGAINGICDTGNSATGTYHTF